MNKVSKPTLHPAHGDLTLCMRERVGVRKYTTTIMAEESFFKQKARIQWLSLGNQNTSYFHKSVNGRQNKNKFFSVIREDGEVVEGHGAVKSEVTMSRLVLAGCCELVKGWWILFLSMEMLG